MVRCHDQHRHDTALAHQEAEVTLGPDWFLSISAYCSEGNDYGHMGRTQENGLKMGRLGNETVGSSRI